MTGTAVIQIVITQSLLARFWAKVNKHGPVPARCPNLGCCWEWTAACNYGGYGVLSAGGRYGTMYIAPRISWTVHHGELPQVGRSVVGHRCDNPLCVRPEHLFLGTDADNVADKVAKGRQLRGEMHPGHKLTAYAVVELRKLRDVGWTTVELAQRYGCSQSLVSAVALRDKWAHIP